MSSYIRALDRRRKLTAWARSQPVGGHVVTAERDMGKFFRSRPGSADHKASCSCTWTASVWSYGEDDAFATAAHHLKQVQKSREQGARPL